MNMKVVHPLRNINRIVDNTQYGTSAICNQNFIQTMQKPQNVLFFTNLTLNDNVVDVPWSGDLKTISIANEMMEIYNVFIVMDNKIVKVNSFYPTISICVEILDNCYMDIVFLSTDNIHIFELLVSTLNYNICILNIPAIHWIESHKTFDLQRLHNMWDFIVTYVDYITTTNSRMMMYLDNELRFNIGLNMKDRLFVTPIGITIDNKYNRNEIRHNLLKCKDSDVIFINSGGVWCWTDMYTFLRAFIRVVNEGYTHYKLYIMGLIQKTNTDIDNINYVLQVKNILNENSHLINTNIFFYEWSDRLTTIKFTHGADVGLNINKNSLENLLSQRVRCSDYLSAGISILCTSGDEQSEIYGDDIGFVCQVENENSYYETLKNINFTEIQNKKNKINKIRNDMTWKNITNNFLKSIENPTKFNKKNIKFTSKISNVYFLDVNKSFVKKYDNYVSPQLNFENEEYTIFFSCKCNGNVNCDIITSKGCTHLGNLLRKTTFDFVINNNLPIVIKCLPLQDDCIFTLNSFTIVKRNIANIIANST